MSVYIDPTSGKLAADTCPNKRLETFVSGTEPTEVCGAHADTPVSAAKLRETSKPTHGGSNSSVGGQINPLKSKDCGYKKAFA